MKCDNCGEKMRVRWTRPIDGVRWREYVCGKCNETKWTQEDLGENRNYVQRAEVHPA